MRTAIHRMQSGERSVFGITVSGSIPLGTFMSLMMRKERGARSVEVTNSAQPIQKNIIKSIESQAKPLKTIDPTQPFDDLKPLKNMIDYWSWHEQNRCVREQLKSDSDKYALVWPLIEKIINWTANTKKLVSSPKNVNIF
ncbi:hypothetical protein [Paenibacillus sp. SYP-B3998]|uniref:hypothetical protein n=1 Tax=Paenibacillus sp. SYP-B3998 TaxID=2678564 RepID=UPI001F080DA3|nr:hypothetical protein [Paenibacillus sp. SYP-B3998]